MPNNNNTVDKSIVAKVGEIKCQPYAKNIVSEDVIERNFGYKIIRQQVSSGRNSVVYRCESAKNPEVYCVIKAYALGKAKINLSLKEETCQIMRFVSGRCQQLISTYEIYYTNEKIYLMCDWAAKGEILNNLKSKSIKVSEEMLRNWATDIISAVSFLHANAICHRNIAPSCLLLTQDNRVKIGTLGDACIYTKPDGTLIKQKWTKFSRSTNWNQPPEVAMGKLYDPRRSDIWSIGATIYWFITKTYPLEYKSHAKLNQSLEHRLGFMRKVSHRCQNFVKKMLTYQPASRPTLVQAKEFDWFTTGPAPTKPVEITTPAKGHEPGEAVGPEEGAEGEQPEPSVSKPKAPEPSASATGATAQQESSKEKTPEEPEQQQ